MLTIAPMQTTLVLTIIGLDKPGLVEAVSQAVAKHGGNWEQSRMAHLANRFAGLLLVTVDSERADKLEADLCSLRDLTVVVERAEEVPRASGWRGLRLDVVGNDRTGIIRDISRALAERGVNVDELKSECAAAPMAGGMLFRMTADLSCPPALAVDQLRQVIEDIANDLMVTLEEHTEA